MRKRSTFAAMAQSIGLGYCRGINQHGFYCDLDHKHGEAKDGVIHLSEPARWSWYAAHRFLILAALAKNPDINKESPWRRVYLSNLEAREIGKQVHLRVPAKYLLFDRNFVLASVINYSNDTQDRKRAFDWARRGGE